MANHPNRSRKAKPKVGIIRASDGRTSPSYAVIERTADGRYYTYLRHHDIGIETRVAEHDTLDAAEIRFGRLEALCA